MFKKTEKGIFKCTGRCSCKKAKQICTHLCKCKGACLPLEGTQANDIDEEDDEDIDDDENAEMDDNYDCVEGIDDDDTLEFVLAD